MHLLKRIVGFVLAVVLTLTALSPGLQRVEAVDYVLEPQGLRGADYTGSANLAALLDVVFAGDIDVYSDNRYTKEVPMPLGTYMSNSTQYYVKSQTTGNPVSGWQCYIYANAVYNKLFREWVGHADRFAHSKVVIPGGSKALSYELMSGARVRCGAYLRTTGNSDGSYSSNVGHSMIILAYDQDTITYLEGNGDGNGLVRVTIRDWDDFNKRQLSGRGRYIAHMVQPTDEFYQAQFPVCAHETFKDGGICSSCGYTFDWECTLDPWGKGIYRLTEDVTPRAQAPYSTAVSAGMTLGKDQKILTTGKYRNAFDQVWYSAMDAEGNAFYVNGAFLKFVEYPEFQATCTGFSPANGAELEQKSYPVKGVITANFPLRSISGYLDGELYASWAAEDEHTTQVDLRQTDINHKLSFSKLEGGKHTVKLVARSFVHGHAVTVHESEFFILSPQPCNHNHAGVVTRDATCTEDGVVTYTCSKCGDAYTRVIVAHGHEYQGGVCIYCGEQPPMSNLTGSVLSGGQSIAPVMITLNRDGEDAYKATASDGVYAISDIMPGEYTATVTKTDCVPLVTLLTLESGDTVFDAKVCVLGDVNGDRNLNIGDISKLYAHVRKANLLLDDYALLCADYNEDGTINIGDVVRLYGSFRKP